MRRVGMAAPNPNAIVENPNPLNVPFVHPLPVLPFPAQFMIDYGDMFALSGDKGNPAAAESLEPSQH